MDLIVLLLIITALIPWINLIRISFLSKKIDRLLARLDPQSVETVVHPTVQESDPSQEAPIELPNLWGKAAELKNKVSGIQWDVAIAPKLPVWIGSVALMLAGFYLMKYSIQQDLLSPIVRVALGYALGIVLLVAAIHILKYGELANGHRIAQALAGSAFAIFYGGSYVATEHYGLIPSSFGLIIMIVVTIVAAIFALKFGEPIAMISLLGGMLTPALFKSDEPNLINLFIYLYFIFSGLSAIAKQKHWWWLIVFAVLMLLGWAFFIINFLLIPELAFFFLVFILACLITLTVTTKSVLDQFYVTHEFSKKVLAWMHVITMLIVLFIFCQVMNRFGMGLGEWMLLLTLEIALLFLAYFQESLYRFPTVVAVAASTALLWTWPYPSMEIYLGVALTMSLIPIIIMHYHLFRSNRPVFWGCFINLVSIINFVVIYYQLTAWSSYSLVGTVSALVISLVLFLNTLFINQKYLNPLYKEAILGLFVLGSGAMFAIGLSIYLSYEFLPIAVSYEMLLSFSLFYLTKIDAFKTLGKCLIGLFFILMVPEWNKVFEFVVNRVFDERIYAYYVPNLILEPWIQLGLPILSYGASVYVMRREQVILSWLGKSLLLFVTLFVYFMIHYLFHLQIDLYTSKESFYQNIIVNTLCYLFVLGLIKINQQYAWKVLPKVAWAFFWIVTFRLVYFDCLLDNPFWDKTAVGGWFVFNSLNFTYLLPIILGGFSAQQLFALGHNERRTMVLWVYGVVLFNFLSLQVRYLFQGNLLLSVGFNNLELYCYSISWLFYGLVLLYISAAYKIVTYRHMAITVIGISILKVFLVDSAELEGLYRVLSFLCLGLVLLGVSYFYTRFISNDK